MEIDRGSGGEKDEKEVEDNNSRHSNTWWGTWGQDWIATVKEKSTVTLNMVKKDLNEFVEVIQGDTADKLSETAAKLENEKEKEEIKDQKDEGIEATAKVVKQGLSKILHSVSELISIEPDDSTDEVITLGDDKSVTADYNRKQEKLHFIQTNPGTYCNEPEGAFEDWLETFTLEDLKQDMSDLLVQNPSVRAIYTQLVPNVVSHTVFWQRYFYQIFLLDVEERKRKEIFERANQITTKADETEDDDGWGDDDDIDTTQNESECKDDPQGDKPAAKNNAVDMTDCKANSQEKNKDIISSNTNSSMAHKTDFKQTLTEKQVSPTDSKGTLQPVERQVETDVSSKQMDVSHETINSDGPFSIHNDSQGFDESVASKNLKSIKNGSNTKQTVPNEPVHQAMKNLKIDQSEDKSSLSSWMSIDDDIKIKKTLGEVIVKNGSKENSDGKTSDGSSAVLVNKSDADDLDDFDLDLEDDVNDEELQKMVQEIKNKSIVGNLQDDEDDDWENWE